MTHEAAAIVTASRLGIFGTRGILGTHSTPGAHCTRSWRRAFDARGTLGPPGTPDSARPASTCLARMCTSIEGMSILTGQTS